MSAFLVAALKVGFLLLFWVFILLIARIIQTDLRATSPDKEEAVSLANDKRRKPTRTPRKPVKTPRVLTIVEGRQKGLEIPLGDPITIGRDANSVLILDDDYVSTLHCTLDSDGKGGFYVHDHASTNGTFINGVRITQPTTLGTADELRIGRTIMKLVA